MNAKPNILFFFTDQQRWDTCGCYGQPMDITPNLDRMADEGVRFEHAFSCQPVCGPVRACLQTGKYATEIGCHTNNRRLPSDEKPLAQYFSEKGYDTAYIGKWHLASEGPAGGAEDYSIRPVPPERRGGYDYWLASDILEFTSHGYDGHMFDGNGNTREFPEGRYRVDAQTDWAIDYLKSRTGETPFFLFLSYIEPHHQNDHQQFEGPHGSKERFKDFPVPKDLNGVDGDWQQHYPDYLGCIHSLDENLGRIRKTLEEQGLADHTLIIFTSDHGCHFCTRTWEYKRSCHESSIHVPLVIQGPGFTGGQTPDKLVSLIDLPPTLLTAGGMKPPKEMRGRPVQDLVNGRTDDWPDHVFVQISESQCGRAIRTERWKYSVRDPEEKNMEPYSDVYVEDCLYDLEADPHERSNLVSDPVYAKVREELKGVLLKKIREVEGKVPEIRS